jgi:hypothetical protein
MHSSCMQCRHLVVIVESARTAPQCVPKLVSGGIALLIVPVKQHSL